MLFRSTAYAIFGTDYGSIDNCFRLEGEKEFTTVPDGIAHYLEHKLFESEDGDAFTLFARTGADSNAFGLNRVPYDNYLTYLHQRERVLTAAQAREMDGGSTPNITVNVSRNTFGAGMDETAVAEAIADTAVRKILAGYRG